MLHKDKAFFLLVFLAIFCAVPGTSHGQSPAEKRPADDLLFKIAVYGPSDDIFIWWGHAALIVENTRWNYSRVFDWGIFSYPSDNFLSDFLKDRINYRSTVDSMNMQMYIDEDRDITVYTLDLDAEGKEIILRYAEDNVLPENCYYDYHEFRDNCSTRIRDIIDMGTGGQFKDWALNTPGRFSVRQHLRRFTWARPASDWFLDFLMGRDLDAPLSLWNEMFLPVEVGRGIGGFSYTDFSGAERKLVSSVELLNASRNRQPVLNAPTRRWPGDLLLGVLAAILVLGLRGLRKKKAGRIAWGLCQSAVGLCLGAAGCVLAYAWFFMKNDYIQQNINLLFVNPLLLTALPLGIFVSAGGPRAVKPEKYLRILWTCAAAAGLLTQLLRLFPVFPQQNQSTAALLLPLLLVFSLAAEGPLFPPAPGKKAAPTG